MFKVFLHMTCGAYVALMLAGLSISAGLFLPLPAAMAEHKIVLGMIGFMGGIFWARPWGYCEIMRAEYNSLFQPAGQFAALLYYPLSILLMLSLLFVSGVDLYFGIVALVVLLAVLGWTLIRWFDAMAVWHSFEYGGKFITELTWLVYVGLGAHLMIEYGWIDRAPLAGCVGAITAVGLLFWLICKWDRLVSDYGRNGVVPLTERG